MRDFLWHRLIGLLMGLAIFGCAGTRTQDVVVYDPLPSQPFSKFLIVGIHENGRTRRLFENSFTQELGRHGVEAIQSHKSIYEERALTLPNVERALHETGADALITVRVYEANVQPKTRGPIPRESLTIDLTQVRRDQVTLRVNVFHVASRQLVLSAFPRSVRPESVESIAREVCEETVKYLAREGLLPRP